MQFIIIVLGIIASSIGLVFLISGIKSSTKIVENHQEENKNDIFLKKYPEVDSRRLIPTFGLLGLAVSLGISYAAIELVEGKQGKNDSKIYELEESLIEYEFIQPEPFVKMMPPEPSPQVPLPPPPKTLVDPKIIETTIDVKLPEVKSVLLTSNQLIGPPDITVATSSKQAVNSNTVKLTPPTPPTPPKPDKIREIVEIIPEYPGGFDALRHEVRRSYDTPIQFVRSKQSGTIHTRFVVLENGSIGRVKIMKGIEGCDKCNQEAIRVIKNLKHKFKPGFQAGQPVKVWYTLPIKLRN